MSEMSDKNVFLILIRLDLEEASPLGKSVAGSQGLPRMEEGRKHALIAGLLDPSQQKTRTPLTPILFEDGRRKELYNTILERIEGLVKKYYDPTDGYVPDPSRLNTEAQKCLSEEIYNIGRSIYDLIPKKTPLCSWFDDLLQASDSSKLRWAEEQHVTIITNDFNIPWYWMRATGWGPSLCEVCSLGMLQLTNRNIAEIEADYESPDAIEGVLRALLINGSAGDLPFMEEEISILSDFLVQGKDRPRRRLRAFKPDLVKSVPEFHKLLHENTRQQRRGQYRLVHYTGHWSYDNREEKELLIGDRRLDAEDLKDFVDSAVLALDGCSSSQGLQAWSEIENLTGKLLNLGALGCVVTTLPVKNDPIVCKIFWEALYGALLSETTPTTLGQALAKGRRALREHFRRIGSANPSWAFYQLIGNPSVRLLEA